MYLLLFILVPCFIITRATRIKDLIPSHKVAKCMIGEVIQNDCVRCVCEEDRYYHCDRIPCDNADQENILLGKPTKAICKPRMVYVQNFTTCVCTKYGSWPHDKCELLFKSLHKRTPQKLTCEPDAYVIVDCNVCKCGQNGLLDKTHCTKNDCSQTKIRKRSMDSVHGNCDPGSWYSLAPCQFCHCVNENKLVCSTGNIENKKLQLGAYNLTICGQELLKEIVELTPDGQKALREGEFVKKPMTTTTTTTTTTAPTTTSSQMFRTTVVSSSIPYETDDRLNYMVPANLNHAREDDVKIGQNQDSEDYGSDSDERNNTISAMPVRIDSSTLLPYVESEGVEESEDEEEINPNYMPINGNFQSLHISPPDIMTTPPAFQIFSGAPDLFDPQMNSLEPTTEKPNVVKIHLPTILDKILQMALRKSMVKVSNAATDCKPGSTTTKGCNYCYCLNNGKLLCTDNQCE